MEKLPPTIDLHEDISIYYLSHGSGQPLGDFHEDIPGRGADLAKYKKANVKCVFAAMFPGIESFSPHESRALKELYSTWMPGVKYRAPQALLWEHLTVYYKISEVYNIKLVESADDLEKCIFGNSFCFILHLEGAEPLEDVYDLVLLKKLGLRSIGLTWNYMNKYATGCNSRKDLGLTSEGEELIKLANKLGIIVDLAHASKKTVLEAISVSSKPVIISHTNIRRFVDKPRNIDDEILEAVAKNKGVVGLSAISTLISSKPKPTVNDLVEHFVYVKESYTVDILGIGTDFLGLGEIPPPEGFESIDKVPVLYSKLLEKGFTEREISKIAYENILRVVKANY